LSATINTVKITPLKNILKFPTIDGEGWTKGYNKNITYTNDGPDTSNPTVATFNDADSGNSSGYWYSYGDYAPQEPNKTYIVQLWVKVEEGYVEVRPYTADNSELTRKYGSYITVNASEGWKLCTWEIITASNNDSDSLSFNWNGNWGINNKKMSISAPRMVTKEEFGLEGIYTDQVIKIEVDVNFTPLTFNEVESTKWDSLEVNIWDDL
jgi:hypothetical protein